MPAWRLLRPDAANQCRTWSQHCTDGDSDEILSASRDRRAHKGCRPRAVAENSAFRLMRSTVCVGAHLSFHWLLRRPPSLSSVDDRHAVPLMRRTDAYRTPVRPVQVRRHRHRATAMTTRLQQARPRSIRSSPQRLSQGPEPASVEWTSIHHHRISNQSHQLRRYSNRFRARHRLSSFQFFRGTGA